MQGTIMDSEIQDIRNAMSESSVHFRGNGYSSERLRAIKKGFKTLHNLETMAVAVYQFQITRRNTEHGRLLIAAMINEMTHLQDFQSKLYEYGFRPFLFRLGFWIAGMSIGWISRAAGRKAVLKTGIWLESKAVNHYTELIRDIEWDEDSRAILEKDKCDEEHHIDTWKQLQKAG